MHASMCVIFSFIHYKKYSRSMFSALTLGKDSPPPPPTVCTNSKTNNNNENKNKSYPFQDVLLVLSVVHEECHLPAGVAVEGVEFLASRVVWKVAVTGVQRLASIHWVQDYLVSNHNLNTHRNKIQTHQNSQTIPASYTVLTSCNSLPSS